MTTTSRHPVSFSVLGVAAAWVLIDLWRVWTPSLITLFGRAAETPPEVMGAFALAVMAVPLVVCVLARRHARLAGILLVVAMLARVALATGAGGDLQLYASSVGVVAAASALCLCAGVLGRRFVPSVFLGVAVNISVHAMLGGFGAVWRVDGWDASVLAVQLIVTAFALRAAWRIIPQPAAARTASLTLPLLLIVLLGLTNVGRASALSAWGPAAVVAGAWIAVAAALLVAPLRRPWVSAAVFVVAVLLAVVLEVDRGGFEGVLSGTAAVGFLVGPAAGARLLSYAGPGRSVRRSAVAAGVGAVAWTVLFFVFYAGYDMGYRADIVIAAAAVLIAAWSVVNRAGGWVDEAFDRAESARIELTGARAVAAAAIAGVVAVVAALVGPALSIPTRPVAASAPDAPLTVAAYNLRMGYGMDGRFVPGEVAAQIRAAGAHVVLLSEVDRGWLLNGGQDQLAIMARMLGMHAVFGPASDQVWGDAILTDLPVSDVASQKYPAFASLTGAAMTFATVRWHGSPIQLVATHLQPDGDVLDATDSQARVFADELADRSASGPVIGGGDLNTTPGSRAWEVLESRDASDVFAAHRPALTSPADDPRDQIDHLFSFGLRTVDAYVVDSTLSDHRMIVAEVQPE